MKLTYLATATAAVALLGGAAYAQDPAKTETPPAAEAAPPADATPAPEAAPPADTSATASASTDVTAPAATTASANASFTTMTVTNGPVPDTKENRAKYGQPMSRAGKMTAAKGN